MNLHELLNDSELTLTDAQAAEAELLQTIEQREAERDELKAKALDIVTRDPNVDGKTLNGLVIEQQGVELRITGAQALLVDARNKIESLKERAEAEALVRRMNGVKALLQQRNTALDAAEDAMTQMVAHLQTALKASSDAIVATPNDVGFHATESIKEGLYLVPAFTQRMWLMLHFSHPMIQRFDTLYADRLGKLSEIFDFECRQIGSSMLKVKS